MVHHKYALKDEGRNLFDHALCKGAGRRAAQDEVDISSRSHWLLLFRVLPYGSIKQQHVKEKVRKTTSERQHQKAQKSDTTRKQDNFSAQKRRAWSAS
jgi:hypothetical protein